MTGFIQQTTITSAGRSTCMPMKDGSLLVSDD